MRFIDMKKLTALYRPLQTGRILSLLSWSWVILIGICTSTPCTAQVKVEESPAITELMAQWKSHNLQHQEVQGWRIQILATTDKRQMESVRRKFEQLYPEYPIHTLHNDPYFQLKTGAFLNTQKAQAFLYRMQKEYPLAVVVTDLVKMDELLKYDQ